MKKKGVFENHIQELKQKKEELPFHKMDDISRRKFIQGVGVFLAALGVPSFVRFEKMSMLSKRIFGSSLAFAADPLKKRAAIEIYTRAGLASSWCGVGYQNHQSTIASPYLNVPWASSNVTTVATSGMPLVLTPNVSGLSNYAGGIQSAMFATVGGHTPVFNATNRIGVCEVMAGRAATEAESSGALLDSPLFFGDTNQVAVLNNPISIAAYNPIPLTHVLDASNMFTPPTFVTDENKIVTESVQDSILAAIHNKFSNDITHGVLQKNQQGILSNADQAQKILQQNLKEQLDPNSSFPGNSDKIAALRLGLPTNRGRATIINGMKIEEIMFVLMQCFELNITPFIGGLCVTTGDWHQVIEQTKSTGFETDLRFSTGAYIGTAMKNVIASASKWTNPYSNGDTLEVMTVMTSEFSRSPIVIGQPNNPDNSDGFQTSVLTMCSNPNQDLFNPGSYGGVSDLGRVQGYDKNKTHSITIPLMDVNAMYGYVMDLHQVDREKLNISSTKYPSTAGSILLKA